MEERDIRGIRSYRWWSSSFYTFGYRIHNLWKL